MARTLLSLLILGSLVSSAFPGNPPAIAYREPQTGIALPGDLGPLNYLGVKRYDKPELGVCIRYGEEGLIKGDIFIYDLGKKNLGSGLQSPAVKTHFEQVKGDIYAMEKMGHYQALDQVSEREIAIRTPRGKIPALSAIFTYSQTEGPGTAFTEKRVSHLVLTAYRGSWLKIRFTYPQNQKNRGETAFKQFMDDLGSRLNQ
jgi:hypothetical protein